MYPVSQTVGESFRTGRRIEFRFRSDSSRFVSFFPELYDFFLNLYLVIYFKYTKMLTLLILFKIGLYCS